MNKKNFTIIGVAGYVARKHVNAIFKKNNNLFSALDPHDNVGFLDSTFPNCKFFKDYERYERHLYKNSKIIDFLVVCSPNFLHDSHIRLALKNNINVICEKPLVINSHNINGLKKVEKETKKKINCILQLRLHKDSKKIKINKNKIKEIVITYVSPRGSWYLTSWKGDKNKSGGVVTNIGIHLFDLLYYIYGKPDVTKVFFRDNKTASGYFEFGKTKVKWFLSIDKKFLSFSKKKITHLREFKADNIKTNFSKSFHDLHTLSYDKILKNKGFGIEDVEESIKIVNKINSAKLLLFDNLEAHPFLKRMLK